MTEDPKWPPSLGPEGWEAQLKPIPFPGGLFFLLSFHAIFSALLLMHSERPDTSTTTPLGHVQWSGMALMLLMST